VGYWGDFFLARSDGPVTELPPFKARPSCSDDDTDCYTLCQEQPGGWQVIQVCHYLPGDDYDWWLRKLVGATGAPVLIGTVADSGVCLVRALAPSGAGLETFLDPHSGGLPEFLEFYLEDETGEAGEEAVERLVETAPDTAARIAAWAAEGGLQADVKWLGGVLVAGADPFVEDLLFELIRACGLPQNPA
jgi:hypothetical protein